MRRVPQFEESGPLLGKVHQFRKIALVSKERPSLRIEPQFEKRATV